MRQTKYPRILLSELFPDIMPPQGLDGIFRYMNDVPWDDWQEYGVTGNGLDVRYVYSHSGDKYISPFLSKFLSSDNTLSNDSMRAIASYLANFFRPKWIKLFSTFDLEYNPINNFSYTKSVVETHGDTASGTYTKNTVDTRTLNTQDNRQTHSEGTNQADKSAYNSEYYSPVDKETDSSTGSDILSKTGTDALAHTGSDSDSSSKEGGYTISESKTGSIGNYMFQDMIKKDRDLWIIDYFNYIFKDVDSMLTLSVYPADTHHARIFRAYGYPNI